MKVQLESLLRFLRIGKRPVSSFPRNMSTEKTKQAIRKMNELMESQQPFLKTGYNIKNLAGELKIPSYQVSALLNRKMGTNFNDYLNHYRVKYGKELIKTGIVENLNLKGLSSKCGFNNRNTFTSAFKKFTGHTPSDYLKHYQHYQEYKF